MLTKAEAEFRVSAGAAHLDRVRPEWVHAINIDRLAMETCGRCALGQLYANGFWAGVLDLYGRTYRCSRDRTSPEVRHGFALDKSDMEGWRDGPAWRLLQDAWVAAIADRKVRATTSLADSLVADSQGCPSMR